jgi:hypothetical protein
MLDESDVILRDGCIIDEDPLFSCGRLQEDFTSKLINDRPTLTSKTVDYRYSARGTTYSVFNLASPSLLPQSNGQRAFLFRSKARAVTPNCFAPRGKSKVNVAKCPLRTNHPFLADVAPSRCDRGHMANLAFDEPGRRWNARLCKVARKILVRPRRISLFTRLRAPSCSGLAGVDKN